MRKIFPAVVDVTLVITCLVLLVLVMQRRVGPARVDMGVGEPRQFLENWEQVADLGVRVSAGRSALTVLEIGDLECPACKAFHDRLVELQQVYHEEFGLVFLHYPLAKHRFAPAASRALECAAAQNQARAFFYLVNAKQDSLGLKSWSSFGSEIGVANPDQFQTCVSSSDSLPRVRWGRSIGTLLAIRGTPTIVVNGWRVTPGDLFDDQLRAIRAGNSPYDGFSRLNINVDSVRSLR